MTTPSAGRDRAHFFAATVQSVRRVLVAAAADHAVEGTLALDEAITRLVEIDPRQARIVELRLFGGLDVRDIAEVLGVPQNKVMRDWAAARQWLQRERQRD